MTRRLATLVCLLTGLAAALPASAVPIQPDDPSVAGNLVLWLRADDAVTTGSTVNQ